MKLVIDLPLPIDDDSTNKDYETIMLIPKSLVRPLIKLLSIIVGIFTSKGN